MLIVDLIILLRLNYLVRSMYNIPKSEVEATNGCAADNEEDRPANNEEFTAELLLQQTEESAMPLQTEVVDHLRGSALVLLLILVNFALGVLVVRFQQPRYLSVAVSCAYAVANILLGLVIFLFHCFKKDKALAFWKGCCRSWCCINKKYILETEGDELVDVSDGHAGENIKGMSPAMNGEAGKYHTIIHGATKIDAGTSDAQSNVSLPSSAALTIERPSSYVEKDEVVENAPSVSDKHSCSSAPLPLSQLHKELSDHPAGYRHSYSVPERQEAPQPKVHAPLQTKTAPIAGTENLTSDSLSNRAPSESAASEKSCTQDTAEQNMSCSASDACSSTDGRASRRHRPPIPAAPLQGSTDRVPTPTKNHRAQTLPVLQEHLPRNSNNVAKQETAPNSVHYQYPKHFYGRPTNKNPHQKSMAHEYHPLPQYRDLYTPQVAQRQMLLGQPAPREQQIARVRPVPHESAPSITQMPLHEQQITRVPVDLQKQQRQAAIEQQLSDNQTPCNSGVAHHSSDMLQHKEKTQNKQPNNNLLHPNSAKDQSKKAAVGSPKKVARVKPTPKPWVPEPSCRVTNYVPVPHLKQQKSYSETSI